MQYKNNPGLCTTNKEIIVGEIYQYKESLPHALFRVKVLEDNSDDWGIKFTLLILGSDQENDSAIDDIFDYSMKHGNYGFGSMPRLFDDGTYSILYPILKEKK